MENQATVAKSLLGGPLHQVGEVGAFSIDGKLTLAFGEVTP
jgi:hypothetical protein